MKVSIMNSSKPLMNQYFHRVLEGGALARGEAADAIVQLFDPEVPIELKAAFLTALQMRGERDEELAGFLETVTHMIRPVPGCTDAADCVGTGSDGAGTFNISTASAILASACGIPMAKHGNRASSSPCGSADVVEALGIPRPDDPELIRRHLDTQGFAFIHAPHFNLGFANIGGLRRTLGMRTLFNLFGPLLNPVFPKYRLIGVYAVDRMKTTAEILHLLGTENAMVVCSEDGLDEISIAAPTNVLHLKNGKMETYTIAPEDAGLPRATLDEIRSGSAAENAQTIRDVLSGVERGPKRDTVLLNTAAVLMVAGATDSLKSGTEKIAEVIDSGAATRQLERITGGLSHE